MTATLGMSCLPEPEGYRLGYRNPAASRERDG